MRRLNLQIYDDQDEELSVFMDFDRCRDFQRSNDPERANRGSRSLGPLSFRESAADPAVFTWKAIKQGNKTGYTTISVCVETRYASAFEERFLHFGPKVSQSCYCTCNDHSAS